ncbi:uncharacterized protein ARMOST_07688 [Armillaria ostoyae]|uniref:Protein kinase domain-containing protein n=1 Tax=Armillaria ostoyae TaxID=47428 RepID=A0A284R6K7_ARMOS|nr:uncharacterized protein ARMOST_07688 [Armillaria ostoyae]
MAVEVPVMNFLQQELDDSESEDPHYSVCMKCLRALSKARDIFPESFTCDDIVTKGKHPIDGGGLSDIWEGLMDGKVVCLKVLRLFGMSHTLKKNIFQYLRREALVWRQLRHENILPFLSVNSSYFEPRHCLISPWMKNGNIVHYLEKNKDHDRLKCIREIANAMDFLHSLDPQAVHGDIRGNNILVDDELCCCLADFGATIVVATQVPSRGTMTQSSSYWLAPELEVYDPTSYDQTYLSARDSYAFGCTIVEIFTLEPPFYPLYPSSIWNHIRQSKPLPRPPMEISSADSDELWELVQKCMAMEPKERLSAKDIKLLLVDI